MACHPVGEHRAAQDLTLEPLQQLARRVRVISGAGLHLHPVEWLLGTAGP